MITTFPVFSSGPELKYVLLWNGTLILVAIGFSASSSAFSLLFGCLGEARRRGDDDGRRDAETTGSTPVHRRSTFQISQPLQGR